MSCEKVTIVQDAPVVTQTEPSCVVTTLEELNDYQTSPGNLQLLPKPLYQWRLNDSVLDSAGSLNGTWIGTASYTTGKILGAASTSAGNYVRTTDLGIQSGASVSFCGWIKATTWNGTTAFESNSFMGERSGNSWSASILGTGSTRQISVYYWNSVDGSTAQWGANIGSVDFNTWFHFVLTVQGDVWSVYINGVLVGQNSGDGLYSSRSFNFYIGQNGTWNSGANNIRALIGDVDDVRVYDVALTAGQVALIYNGGAGTEEWLLSSIDETSYINPLDVVSMVCFEPLPSAQGYYFLLENGTDTLLLENNDHILTEG